MRTVRRSLVNHTHRPIVPLCFLAVAAWLCGCSGVSVKGSWPDGAPRDQTYSRVLVIGVSPDRDLRCAFEATFASELRSTSTTAIPSCQLMSAKEPLNRETVERAAAAAHADAVLATRLVTMHTGQGDGNSDDMRGHSVYKATDFAYGAYGMPVTELDFQTAAPLTSIRRSLHVVTRLYETRSAALIYTIDTETKPQEIDSTEATLVSITGPTADRLRRTGLIR